MTLQEWWLDLINPQHLLTEGLYNVVFEIIATVIFVRVSLKKLLRKELEKYGITPKED
jgi:hypothetical protein